MTFFLVIDQVFRIFPYFYQIFRIFCYVQCRIWPFPHKNSRYFWKKFLYDTFFTLFALSRVSDNTTSQNIENIGGDKCMGRPPRLKFMGGPSPQVSAPV